jgi:S-DNA-T family DNA segregation ATPase FtsK/SpoIIIE
MKIKFTLARSGTHSVDLVATVDAATTVGELAEHLVRADPTKDDQQAALGPGVTTPTLGLAGSGNQILDPHQPVGDSELRSGAVVTLTTAGVSYADPHAGAAAVVEVTAGPDTGRKFTLRRGPSVIGREHGCEVRLTDPLVSRQHARINITDLVEIIDLGSANGVVLGDSVVSRSVLGPADTIGVGDTELLIRVLSPAGRGGDGASTAFVRSPYLDPHYEGVDLPAPEPPQRSRVQRFPVISLIAPLLMGGLLYLITRSVTSLAFVALTPLMLVGTALETKWSGKADFRQALREFRTDLAGLVADAGAAAEREVAARNREHPSTADCVDAVLTGNSLLWSRRPADPGFVEVRLGLGTQPARNTISLPDGRRAPRDVFGELVAATEKFATVADVPVVGRPADHGAIGLAGARQTVLAAARALLVQLVALHSPAELVVVGFASSQSARDWDWLKWLPHTTSVHSPLPSRQLAATGSGAAKLAAQLEELLAGRSSDRQAGALPAVLVLVEDDAPVDRSRLVGLAEQGWAHGIHVIWVASDTSGLPAACRTFVRLAHQSTTGTVGFVHSAEQVAPLAVDLLDEPAALDVARSLAPLVDTSARVDDDSDLPRSVSMLGLMGPDLARSAKAVIERWNQNRSILTGPYATARPSRQPGGLRAVIGQSAGQTHALDLRADGPHALVGGTTGSGKSELLQAWILAMATAHSPQRLTFLLIDYKGGSAFSDCVRLPHTVGLVTDLSPYLVRRALTSLSAELRYREHVLAKHRAKDLVELEKAGLVDAPPSLVIVVDEFAALVSEVPEFVDGVVNVAQRGRSLGLHLILATQRPAGVIKDNLRANTNLRLALRMADENDSVDVLGSPQAAFFDPALPGRAVSKTGPGRLVTFQTGYAGGWTSDQPPSPEILVEELSFGGGALWEVAVAEDASPGDPGPTDISRVVLSVSKASELAELPAPRKPWLRPLATLYDVSSRQVPSRQRDDELVFGIRDDPANQAQPTVAFHPDQDGNLAVYGTGGSGKSTLLRTLAVAAGFTVRGGPCHVYGLDFGARGLAMLADLPHVGSIVPGADHERVVRLLTWLRELVNERAMHYSGANAGTITEYRKIANRRDEPRILLLLDGVAAFRQAYEVGDRSKWFDTLVGIAADGRPVGVHLLLSADRAAAVPSVLASAVQRRVVLRMADAGDYGMMGVPVDVLTSASPPGRGLLGDAEFQVAILGQRPDVGAQAERMHLFAVAMRRAGVPDAPAVQRLEERIPLAGLPSEVRGQPVLGVSSDTLGPHSFVPRGSFLICGPPGSGRTTAILAVATALRRWHPDIELHYLGSRRSALAGLDLWRSRTCGPDEVAAAAIRLAGDLAMAGESGSRAAVFIENIAEFVSSAADHPLQELAKVCLGNDLLLVAEGETSTLTGSYPLFAPVKSGRTGLALQPDANDGLTVFRTNFPPRLNRADFPAGRALFVAGGRTTTVQVGQPDTD